MIGNYIIDMDGRVYNQYHQAKTEHFDKQGYSYYKLSINGVKGNYKTHILQAKEHPEICGEWFKGAVVHHIDYDKRNNTPENLRVMTYKEHILLHSNSDITKSRRVDGNKDRMVKVMCVDTGKVFNSVREASEFVNGEPTNIVKCCRHKIHTAYGYKWKYYGMD